MDIVERILFRLITIVLERGKLYNYFFSNVSIGISIRLDRAWDKDQTEEQLGENEKLFLDTDPVSRWPAVDFITRAWESTTDPLNNNFRHVLTNVHKVPVDTVDFQNQKGIEKNVNTWAEKETNGYLKDFLRLNWVHNTTVFMFGSLLDVKGPWNCPFLPSETKVQSFYLEDGTSVQAPFMATKKTQYLGSYAINGIQFKVLNLRYKQGVLDDPSMLIVLPQYKEQFSALRILIGQNEKWFFDKFNPTKLVPVCDVRIPKFNQSFRPDPMEFHIKDSQYTYSIFTKGVMEMNESGTRAAGVALGTLRPGTGNVPRDAVEPPSLSATLPLDGNFVANHQFLFFIRDNKNRRMWYNGAVINPNKDPASLK